MEKAFELQGIITVTGEVTEDEIMDKFIEFIESNGWCFGGGIKEID